MHIKLNEYPSDTTRKGLVIILEKSKEIDENKALIDEPDFIIKEEIESAIEFSCDICKKTFSSQTNLNTHRKFHNIQKLREIILT